MSQRKVAIIGCGYVGSALAKALVRNGSDVIGTTTTPSRQQELSDLAIRPVVVELADVNRLHLALADRDTVFCMVAPSREHRDYEGVYLNGVGHLIEAAEGTSVRHIVYTSSTSVYGQTDGSWVDETSPTEPRTESGRTLLAAEQRLQDRARRLGITATILRLAGIHGPDRGPINIVHRYAGTERNDGEGYVNLIHCDDIVRACLALLDRPYDGVLNLAGDHPIRRRELYDRLLAAKGLPAIQWTVNDPPDSAANLGKRVRNRRSKEVLRIPFGYSLNEQ